MAVRTLERPPSMAASFARAGAGLLPGTNRLPFIGIGGGGGEVPDLTLVLDGVSVDRNRLAAYDRICGFGLGNRLPPTYPHILAFPLQLALMTDASFPVPAIGLVHIANEIIQHRRLDAREPLDLRVWATPLEPHAKGRQFSLRTEVRADGELVWEETSTNLRRGRGGEGADPTAGLPSVETLDPAATWTLAGDLGRRYGAVSGDLNPIHVHPLTARAFGFPGAIAHGMWTKARCLAALGPRLPDAFSTRVAFRRPIILPAKIVFSERERTGGVDFGVRDARRGTPHLEGTLDAG